MKIPRHNLGSLRMTDALFGDSPFASTLTYTRLLDIHDIVFLFERILFKPAYDVLFFFFLARLDSGL